MPFYYSIREIDDEAARRRTAEGLLRLRKQLAAEVPKRTLSDTLLLATWNIREFDSEKYGDRSAEPLHYIAEIISHFDLVAVQEVREDLTALDRVQEMLGGWWKYIVTDVTAGSAGNGERMAFLYDGRKVTFGGLAGEVVLPAVKSAEVTQFARTPFLCGFKASWTKFNICTMHAYYGTAKADDPRRIKEIEDIAEALASRAKPAKLKQPARPDGAATAVRNTSPENLILLGDFNIFARADRTFEGLTKAGFVVPEELLKLKGSNLKRDKYYDQIAFLVRPDRFGTTSKADVFDFYKSVFRDDQEGDYAGPMGPGYGKAKKGSSYYNQWRTFQMSDHLLLWVELKIDFGEEYLTQIAAGDLPPPAAERPEP